MESGPEVRKRMLEHAARLPPKPPKVTAEQLKCARCGSFDLDRVGNRWRCCKCGLDNL